MPVLNFRSFGAFPAAIEGRTSMRKIIVLFAATAALAVAACNTVEGAGRDVTSAGRAVTDTAQDAK
jgi:predicted small secreted protein